MSRFPDRDTLGALIIRQRSFRERTVDAVSRPRGQRAVALNRPAFPAFSVQNWPPQRYNGGRVGSSIRDLPAIAPCGQIADEQITDF